MKPLLAIALRSASVAAVPAAALAQAGAGGDDPGAPTAYAGASKPDFYSVEDRMADLERRAVGHSRAMAMLRQAKAFAAQQRARHGELRDWDREVITMRLDRVEQSLGRA
jgi:hypothetical protein